MLLISPHLDDAALSCAVRVGRGDVSKVVTVFAGVPPTGEPLTDWDVMTRAEEPRRRMLERRAEDEAAWRSVGQDFEQWDHQEYRAEGVDREELGRQLAAAAAGRSAVLVPAGIGGHPHHILVRNVAIAALAGKATILLYGELPYAAFFGWPRTDPHLDVKAYWRTELAGIDAWRAGPPRLFTLSPEARAWKRSLLSHYQSQLAAVSGGSLELFERTPLLEHEVEFAIS